MNAGTVSQQLGRKLRQEGWTSLGLGCALILVALLAAAFTYWALYVISFFVFGIRGANDSSRLTTLLAITAACFPLHTLLDPARTVRVEIPNAADPEGPPIVLHNRRQDTEADMDPNSWRDSLRQLLGVFFFAPILLRMAFEMIQRGLNLLRLDVARLGPVVELLASRKGRTPFAELFSLFPQLDPRWLARALHDIEGVVFLNPFPAGVSLTPELRTELSGMPVVELSEWPEAPGARPDYVAQSECVPDLAREAPPMPEPPFKYKLSELAFTLIVRFLCGCVLGFGAFCFVMFGPRRSGGGSTASRADWFQHPTPGLPLIFILGGGVICVLTTPRWMWRGGLE